MYTFSVSNAPDSNGRCFQVRPSVVAFAGSRRGSVPDSVSSSLVHSFHSLGFSLLTGCAAGIDECFRRVMVQQPFEQQSMVACAFESRARGFNADGLHGIAVVPLGLSPAAALHRRTVWIVRRCGLLVLFPVMRTDWQEHSNYASA